MLNKNNLGSFYFVVQTIDSPRIKLCVYNLIPRLKDRQMHSVHCSHHIPTSDIVDLTLKWLGLHTRPIIRSCYK